jgi:hypothetical protein
MTDDAPRICFDRILPEELDRHADRFTGDANLPFRMALLFGKAWEEGKKIKVAFMDGHPEVQSRVEDIAHEWSEHANVGFEFGNDADAEIRISFEDSGSWSYLGIDALSIPAHQATMNYGWLQPGTREQEYRRVVLHEFGHALSAIHEHQNPAGEIPWDKEAVYRAYGGPPNNWTRQQIDHNLFAKYSQTVTQFSDFDRESIMLYPIPAELLTDPSHAAGLNTELSETDRAFISTLYRFPDESNRLEVGGGPVEEEIHGHGEHDEFWFSVDEAGRYVVETHGPTDVVMTLAGPNDKNRVVAEDDDSGRDLNAHITADLEPGRWFARVWHFWPRGTGRYSVTVDRG